MGFKVLLSIPPDYDHYYPPLGTPALTAFLRKKGIACDQVDLNIPYRDFLANHIHGASDLTVEEKRFFLKPALEKFFTERLAGRYYSSFFPRSSPSIMQNLPYNNNTNSAFYFTERLLSSEYLWRYLDDIDENTFYQFFDTCGILAALEREDIHLFGISIISPSQAIASLTLGWLIKKRLPHIHVSIGGQWATLYRAAIMQKKELFRCFDSIITFEGESALYELAKALESGNPVSSIPNIIVEGTTIDPAATRHEEDLDSLPCPDFDGLPLSEYDASRSGRIELTYETSRGCYWSKCAYCVDLPLPKPSYRRKDPRLVVAGMRELEERYNAQYLLFGDPGLSPRQMREISECMIREGVRMELWTMARLDAGFDRKLFDLAFKAGFRQINFGFESANDRVCASLDKGNFRDRSSRIIRDCAAAGIKVDLQTMVGLPGERFEDALDTIDFLASHRDAITSVTFNTYYCTPFNYVYQDPAKYGIEYDRAAALPFGFFIPFRNIKGMDAAEAETIQGMYHALARKEERSREQPIDANRSLLEGWVEMRLNGEVSRLRYHRNPADEVYEFIA